MKIEMGDAIAHSAVLISDRLSDQSAIHMDGVGASLIKSTPAYALAFFTSSATNVTTLTRCANAPSPCKTIGSCIILEVYARSS